MPTLRLAALLLPLALIAPPVAAQQEEDASPRLSAIVEEWLASPHADLTDQAFRHWDEDGEIPGDCAVCHSGQGFTDFVRSEMEASAAIDHPVPIGPAVDCAVCHSEAAESLDSVLFQSGAVVDGLGASAVCSTCHQGRASSLSVASATDGLAPDTVSPDLTFINIHYKAAAATLMGAGVHGGYEYPGRDYAGRFGHVPGFDDCTGCHQPHTLEVAMADCALCHERAETFTDIRTSRLDADGDGDRREGVYHEIAALTDLLGGAIETYAREIADAPIVYAADAYPYFFADSDEDGAADPGEAIYPNRYAAWTPRLLRAAYNYQYAVKDTGGYTHNPAYVLQLLHDSVADLATVIEVPGPAPARP
jgi:hypothetical protein